MKKRFLKFICLFGFTMGFLYANTISLDTIQVVAKDQNITNKTYQNNYGGTTVISKGVINSLATQNGDITSVLRINPNVSFNLNSRTSNNLGEISPQDISINGGLFYQNNFMIDSFNMNNDINPDAIKKFNDNHTNPFGLLDNKSQGINLDIDLVDNIEVHDSFVPAKFGSFTGGVVKAKTKNPSKEFGGKISVSHTRDSWTKFHSDDRQKRVNENGAVIPHQDKFKKTTYRLNLEGFLTDNFGILSSYSKTISKIPTKDFDKEYISNEAGKIFDKDLKKELDNIFLKGVWYIDRTHTLTPTFAYAKSKEYNYLANSINSFSKQKSDDYNLGLELKSDFYNFDITQSFSYSKMNLKRDSDTNYFLSWWGDDVKNWGSGAWQGTYEGGYGDIEQSQETFSYSFDLLSKEINFLNTTHKINAGFEYQHKKAKFTANEDMYMFGLADFMDFMFDPTLSCKLGDKLCSDKGYLKQYFKEGNYYKKGSVDVDLNQISLYLDDEIKYKNLTIRPGIRYDWDDYMDKHAISPRLAGYYDIFGDEKLILSAGANRYYGRSSFAYKLNHEIYKNLERKMTRQSPNDEWIFTQDSDTKYESFKNLDLPYSDELAFGVGYKFSNFALRLKYVNRDSKDQILAQRNSNQKLYYTNDGESQSDIYTISFKNLDSYNILGTINDFEIAFDYQETERNMESSRYNGKNADSYIKYNGKIIQLKDKPSEFFNDEWTLRLMTHTKIPNWNLTISNFFSLKAPFELEELSQDEAFHNGKNIPVIETKKYSTRFNWDVRVNYTQPISKNKTFFVNLDILNVTNEKNIVGFNDGSHDNINKPVSYDFSENLYEPGRQFWLEVGLDF